MALRRVHWLLAAAASAASVGQTTAQEGLVSLRNDSVMIRFVETDLRAAVQALARHLDRPLLFGGIGEARVTLETPTPVVRSEVIGLLRGLLDSHNYDLVSDSGHYRIRPRQDARSPNALRQGAQQGGPVQLFVIRLRHAAAADVAATVNALYGRASALGELGGRPQTLTEELRQNRVAAPGVPPTPAAGATPPASLSGEVTIIPDKGTNSLLIRSTQTDFQLIQAAVEQLDIRPLQVLIEVLIAEVRRDRSRSLGVAFGLDTTRVPDRLGVPGDAMASNRGLDAGDFVIRLMTTGDIQVDATLRAAAARGDVKIRSQPVLVAANNEQAQILVGSQRPFVQVSRSLPTDAPSRDQVVQYKDVGTQLNIHPTISADGYIMLDVTQEINAATTETAFDAPVISTRSVQTRLLVKDGQTAVLGGLTDEQSDNTRSGIPVLSSLPVIGWLFGHSVRRAVDTELFVFLTPRVIREDFDVDDAALPYLRRSNLIKR
jgi:general secretion pathway protein D